MKSFTKFFALMMAMLLTLGVYAQADIAEQKRQVLMQQAQQEMIDHGPTVEVPPAPEGSSRAVGDDCTDPIVIDFSTDLPFSVTGETTCGRGNNYFNSSCIGFYDGGEDIHYELIVTSTTLIDVLYDPVQTWSGIAIKDACGDAGSCIYLNTGSSSAPRSFTVTLDPGTYYLTVDTWPSPNCVDFDLSISEVDMGDCSYSIDLTDTWGDGWNGNTINVYAGGVEVAGSPFTLSSGTGPVTYTIPVNRDDEITTNYNQIGGWPYENGYKIYDYDGVEVFSAQGAFPNGPESLGPGIVFAECPFVGSIEGTVSDGDGNPVEGASVGIVDVIEEMTDASGYYRLNDIRIGIQDVYAFVAGINYIVQQTEVFDGETSEVNFTMESPLMVITPAVLEETMNPNEWRSVPITITNGPTGGALHWTAEIIFGEPPAANAVMPVSIETIEALPSIPFAGGSDLTSGQEAPWGPITASARGTNDGLDIVIVQSQIPSGNDFSAMISALISLGVNSVDEIALNPLNTTVDDLLAYDGVIFGLNTFFTAGTDPVGDLLADYVDAGGKLIITSPINATGYPNLPVGGRLLDEGYYPCTTGGLAFGTVGLGTYNADHPIMEGVTSAGGSLTINCGTATDAETVAEWNSGTTFVATKTITNPVVHVNSFIAATGYVTGQVDLVIYNALNWLQSSGGSWLSLSAYEGDVAPGESDFVSALFDATGTEAGQVWTADVLFTAEPDISTATVDVSMIIAGEPLVSIDELEVELVDMVTGQVDMSWSFANNDITFEYFLVRRDGAPIANTQFMSFTDFLPDYGEFCYTVSAVYTEGESAPAGPECVIWLIPELCYMPDPLYGEVWTGDAEIFPLWLENCGEGMLSFEFTGFDDPDFSNGFVTAVDPYMGAIAEGEGMYVNVTFDATGYGAGTYFADLDLMTNELAPDNERLIACEMFAYTPAILYGMVTDCDNGLPLSNVTVKANGANSFGGETDATGYYEFWVDEDTYDIDFSKLSYTTTQITGIFAPQGDMTEVNAALCETPYPVQWVVLDPNEADTQALISWSLPMGPYEIIYDDGTAENYFAWIQFGGAVAVKFTPAGYPASVAGGRLFVGDGSYPEGANFIGQQMAVGIFDDDGPNGMPGTVLDSSTVTVNNYGWVDFGLNGATFNDGNFYVGMWQITIPPFSAPVGIDEENPVVFRSYTKQAGMDWQMSAYNDFMIRATVFGPGDNVMAASIEGESVAPPKPIDGAHIAMKRPTGVSGTIKGGTFAPVVQETTDRDLEKYRVALVDDFDPDMGETPLDGTITPISTTSNNTYTHNGWGGLDPGFYAYAVRAEYTSSNSEWAYSNVAAHLLDREVTVNVVQCDGEEPSGALVTLMGFNYPYQMLAMMTPASGTVVFDSVILGIYDLDVNKLGYQPWAWPNMVVADDMTVDVTLQETEYPPRNLYVDPLTSVATWDEPLYIQVPFQSFEEETFPPAGWLNLSNSDGWERVESPFSTSFWGVPDLPDGAGDWFAVAEDDSDLGDDCCTYLVTTVCDLREASDYTLDFLYYFDGAYGAAGGFVHYSTDGGATWVELELLATGFDWQQHSIDLADFSGPDGESAIWFAFQYDDGGGWASGFAVDNVYLGNGPVEVMGYHVFLDDGFVAETDAETRTYQYGDLQYGTVYTAAVAALYACNVSDPIYYTFTSSYLYPPRNLYNEYLYNTNEVPLFWNPPVTGDGVPMIASSPAGEYVKGLSEPNAGRAPLNGVAVTEGETADPALLNGFRAPTVYGVSNDIPAYASFDAEAPGTVTTIASWPGGGAFSNASEIVTGSNGEEMYEVDNSGAARHINLLDGTVTSLGNIGVGPNAMALDYTSGIYYVTEGDNLYTVDFDDVSTELVGSLGSGAGNLMIGMTFDNNGDLFMYDLVVDNMWSCDKETGACTQIGSIGFDANFGQGMAWDQENGQAVLSAFNSGSFACEYRVADLTTGNTTFLGNIGNPGGTQFGTICIPASIGPGGGGDVPDGLVSFNVYQDEMMVGNQPYEGQAPDELVSWVHNPVDPGCYEYTVTAVYDLSVYGFPGQVGESYHEGPDTACVVWGYDLPFMEMWDEGSLDFNQWSTSANNWMISSGNGNPEPSAQFNWDPDPGEEYAVALTSAPLKADLLTEGDIWMDFEFFLENRTATGDEKLAVEVHNGQEWMQVAEFANTTSYDWTFQHLKITDYAMSRVFQVRFSAMGMNSFDVVRWNVDNIHIYRVCEAPSELAGEYLWNVEDDFGAELMWTAPEIPVPPQGWIRWDDGVLFSGVGLVDGGDFSVAARWDAGQLEEYAGTSITQMQIALNDDGYTSIDLKIWTGSNASNLVYEATVSPAPGTWEIYTIDPPVTLDVNDELWIGYTVNGQPASTFPAGTDAGPAVAGYGDKITTDGTTWDNLSDFGLDYNWSVAAYVETLDGTTAALPSLIDDTEYSNATTTLGLGDIREVGVVFEDTESSRDFTGFNIYRMGPDEMDYTLIDNVPYEEGVMEYSYYDADPYGPPYPYSTCYQVTAVWESETDYCESMPALAVIPIDDFVCITVTSIDDPLAGDMTSLYPNPASDQVNITSSQKMERITVVNYVGQMVYESELSGEQSIVLNTGSYEAGVYIVKIDTSNGVVTKRMIISR